jgi:putative ABC transport system permease protein
MPFLASIVPVILGTRVKILEAMTDFGISAQYGHGPVARFISWLPVPMFVRHALANISQKKGRLSMTGVTLTVAVGAFMGVCAVFISVGGVLDDIFNTFNYQLEVRPVWPEDYDYDAVATLMDEGLEDIAGIYPANDYWLIVDPGPTTSSDRPRRSLHVTGFDLKTDTLKLGLDSEIYWETASTLPGIVITRMVAENNGWQVGDTITLGANDRSREFEIIAISSFPESRGFADWSVLAEIVGVSTPYKYWLQFDGENHLTGVEVDRKAGDIREALLQHGIVADFDNQRAWAEDQTQTLWSIALIFNIASLVMALVGAIGLLAMMSISVFERQREIGVMRAVGAGSRTIAGQFLIEGLLIGAFAWLIGIPLSYGIAVALANLLPVDEFEFNYPLIAALMGLAGMLTIATLASLWPSMSAARKTVSDILRYQ